MRNIQMLAEMLVTMGFDAKLGNALLKRASFRPETFSIGVSMPKGKDLLQFQICFERREDAYHFRYYDASLRKEIEVPEALQELDKKMEAVNWVEAFAMHSGKAWSAEDKDTWKNEAAIEAIVVELETVEDPDAVARLKVKHWGNVQQDMFSLNASKYEITQRFYFFEDQGCIGADEAYKFLQHRWLEKQMLAKRRQESAEPATETASSNGRALLPKKRGAGKKKNFLS